MSGTKLASEGSSIRPIMKTGLTFNPQGINPYPEFISVRFRGRQIFFKLDDGRTITVPFESFPKLANATIQERENYHTNGVHIFWYDLDEIIGVKNVLGPGATKY